MDIGNNLKGRFAPSPSGILHLGNIATMLLAWLDVRKDGGKLILRIEDLDPDRCKKEYTDRFIADLAYLGIDWDEGYLKTGSDSFMQSRRTSLYEDVFEQLLKKDLVYPCYCNRSQRLAASAPHEGEATHDAGCACRHFTLEQRLALEHEGKRPAWKIKVPDKDIEFFDLHYGRQVQNLAQGGDFIIKRSDGVFAYQLAVSFDDMAMGVNRVVRGRDLLSSTARQIWLINELGGTIPQYCHTPLLTAEDARKLSKRNGDLNMLALREKYSGEEIIGITAQLLNISDRSAVSAYELIDRFDWAKVPKNDIIIK